MSERFWRSRAERARKKLEVLSTKALDLANAASILYSRTNGMDANDNSFKNVRSLVLEEVKKVKIFIAQ